jgi:hypothetical protein
MSAMNIVRLRTRPGCEQRLIDYHRNADTSGFSGYRHGWLVHTGERNFYMVGEWDDFASIERSRPAMIGVLDGMRELLEVLGGGLGVTDPVSGEVVAEIT